jgi:hypothetical protein
MSAAEQLDREEVFDARLRQWARYFGERRARGEEDAAYQEAAAGAGLYRSPAGKMAGQGAGVPGLAPVGRDSSDRRTHMGQAAGLLDRKGNVAPVPSWAVEHIRATETRSSGGGSYVPEDAQRIERAVLDLQRVMPAHGLAFRLNHCTAGHPAEKAARMGIGRGKLREMVAEARGWIRREVGG